MSKTRIFVWAVIGAALAACSSGSGGAPTIEGACANACSMCGASACGANETSCVAQGNQIAQEASQAGCSSQFAALLVCLSEGKNLCGTSCTVGVGGGTASCPPSPCEAQTTALGACGVKL